MATKIQVRRDTTANWTTYGAEVPAAGEFCYDTDEKTLKIGDGVTAYRDLNVIADADFDVIDADDKYVAVSGDNMTGALTIGPDGGPAVTTLTADGSAEFAGVFKQVDTDNGTGLEMKTSVNNWSIQATQDSGNVPKGLYLRGTSADGTRADGLFVYPGATGSTASVWFPEQVTVGGTVSAANSSLKPDGSAEFAGDVQVDSYVQSPVIVAGGTQTSGSNAGSINVRANDNLTKCLINEDIIALSNTNAALGADDQTIRLVASDGSATFAGTVTENATRTGGVTIELERDNPANYTTSTDSEGNETRVYNGPTLDVKAVIQELQQRVADRDAVIADFATRIAQLEADHATMMGNSNGGY